MGGRDTDELQRSFLTINDFIPLIWSAMRLGNVNCAELSRQTKISKTKLSRGLSGKSPIDLSSIQRIFLALGIDTQRALLAIGHLGDWNRYYDLDIVVVSDLIRHLPATLAAARDGCERIAISDGGIKYIADYVSAMIADNDRKVSERINSFTFDGGTRRAG